MSERKVLCILVTNDGHIENRLIEVEAPIEPATLARMHVMLRDIFIGRTIEEARALGADAIVVACPLCHANLDTRQNMLGSDEPPIPILYITELMGLAFGLPYKELGLQKHIVPTVSVVGRSQKWEA